MSERVLGRVDARPYLESIQSSIRVAPKLFRGPLPRRSPNIRRFRNPRLHHQVTGTCVGQSGASLAETTIRTPDGFKDDTKPNKAIDVSPLWVYAKAREYTARTDRSIYNGEGAVVSHALLAMKEAGFVGWDAWPCTEANERAFRDGVVPTEALQSKKLMPIGDVRRLETWDQVREYLAGGYSVWIGVSWPSGAMSTTADGKFSWSGRSVGGHAVELVGYDEDAGVAWINNSWQGWGDSLGCGYTSLPAIANVLSDRNLASGGSEAVVISNVDGWGVKVDVRQQIYDAL